MKALLLDRPGSFDNLRVGESPRPDPGPGEVRVRAEAVGLNPVDYKLLQWGPPAWTYPFILGLDVAGIVDAVGPGVERWQPGDRVVYHGNLTRPGGLAEYAVSVAHTMARIPDTVAATDAAALPCAGLTAYLALVHRIHLRAGQTVLVQAGAGGVGGFGVQIAAHLGATVITTCSAHNIDYVMDLGAHHAIDYRSEDVAVRVRAITGGRGVDAVLDMLSADSATEGLHMLAFGGALACVEALPDFSGWHMFDRGVSVHEITLGGAYGSGDRIAQENLGRMMDDLIALVAAGHVRSMVTEIVPLEGVPGALRRLEGRHVRGKIVVQIG